MVLAGRVCFFSATEVVVVGISHGVYCVLRYDNELLRHIFRAPRLPQYSAYLKMMVS